MLNISISNSEAFAALEAKAERLAEVLRTKLDLVDIQLQSHIVQDKLSGQVLKHRTGTLANSIRVIPAQQEGNAIVGKVEGAGGPAWYGRLHEFGTDTPFTIVANKAKALAFIVGDKQVFAKRVTHPPFKERSFMRTSAAEMAPQMREKLNAAVGEALNE